MSSLIRCCRAATLALLFCGLLSTVAAAVDPAAIFSLRPARSDPARPATKSYFVLDATPGRTIDDEVVVRNSGTAAGTVQLFAVDAVTGQNGGATFPSDTDPRRDVGSWIRVNRGSLTLQPGEEQTVAFTITIPADATPGEHLGGLVALDTAIKQGAAGTLRIDTQNRMVTAVQVNLPGPTIEQMTVAGVSTSGTDGQQFLLLDLRNDGNTLVRPSGTVTVTDATGKTVQELPFKIDTFVPNTGIQYPLAIERQALGPGQYHATVALQYGASGTTAYSGNFDITPAQVAKVFPSAAPLAPPQVAAQPIAAPAAPGRSWGQWWSVIAGVIIVISVGFNLVLLVRRAASRRA